MKTIILAIVVGLLVNELTEFSPWLARQLVRWSASRWAADPEVASAYIEEWTAVIDERPGKLFKLFTAIGFMTGGLARMLTRTVGALLSRVNRNLVDSSASFLANALSLAAGATVTATGVFAVAIFADSYGGVGMLVLVAGSMVVGVVAFFARISWMRRKSSRRKVR